jgi:hypothetical protein
MGNAVKIFILLMSLALTSCTRSEKGPDGKPLVGSSSDPERLVVEAKLSVPPTHAKKVKRTDLLIWSLRDAQGDLLAGNITAVPTFPHTVKIKAGSIIKPSPESSNLLFTARIVKFGEESLPPKKGELQVSLGAAPSDKPEVVNPNVDPKLLEKFMKKMNITPLKSIVVGSKAEAEFGPKVF